MIDPTNVFESNTVVSIFCDRANPNAHLTGWICASSEEATLIQHVSPRGLYDGFILIHTDDFYRIDAEGKYETKISQLYKIKKQKHPVLVVTDNLYASLLSFCMEHKHVISVELEGTTLSGFVTAFDDYYITLFLVDKYGDANGKTVISNSEVISFSVDSQCEQDIKLLYCNSKA